MSAIHLADKGFLCYHYSMSLFSKPKAVLWPKEGSTELYLDRAENNIFPIDINLWKTCTPAEIQSQTLLLAQNKVDSCTILIPDDVVYTKSFVYDSEVKAIDKTEVIGLAESFVKFKNRCRCNAGIGDYMDANTI